MNIKINKLITKESVERGVLTVSLSATIALGIMLYDSNYKLKQTTEQLGETQIQKEQIESNYKQLENKFLSVQSDNKKLSERNKELEFQLDNLNKENDKLKKENDKLKKENDRIKKDKVGTGQVNPTVPTKYKGWKKINVQATGYSLYDDPMGHDGTPQTATGTYPKEGRTIAVDPRVIPYGTEVYIPALNGVFIAEDTGGLIKGNKIDIYFSHGSEARQWGRKNIEIYVDY
jgi:3D (Asp-Asp-Asp) domain-containing protein